MANRLPVFFYAPTWDYPPDGPIKVGNVLASVKTPEVSLCTIPLLEQDEAFATEKRRVEISAEKLREGRFSIITKFLSFLGVGVDIGANWSAGIEETFSFDTLETTQFFPRDEYFRKCVEAVAVRRFLEKCRYRKPIYTITGVKVVTGARATSLQNSSFGANLGVDVDATVWTGAAIPVAVGPAVSGNVSQTQGTSWEGSSNFILAYRLQKITVSKAGTVKRTEDYHKGAMLDVEVAETKAIPELDIDVDTTELAQVDGFVEENVSEGDVMVICAVPDNGVLKY